MLNCMIKNHTYKYITVEEKNISIYFIASDHPCWLYEMNCLPWVRLYNFVSSKEKKVCIYKTHNKLSP
jgi:hypothetical protein